MPREKFKTLTEQMFYILLCLRREYRRLRSQTEDYDRVLREEAQE